LKYIYAALLLHSSAQKIDEESIRKVLTASGADIDEARIKALIASLSEVDIDEAIKAAPGIVTPQAAPTAAPAKEEEKGKKEEEKGKEEEEKEEEAIAGLGALFQ